VLPQPLSPASALERRIDGAGIGKVALDVDPAVDRADGSEVLLHSFPGSERIGLGIVAVAGFYNGGRRMSRTHPLRVIATLSSATIGGADEPSQPE
jgi:hypothetical protein